MRPGNDTKLSHLLQDARGDIVLIGQRVQGAESHPLSV